MSRKSTDSPVFFFGGDDLSEESSSPTTPRRRVAFSPLRSESVCGSLTCSPSANFVDFTTSEPALRRRSSEAQRISTSKSRTVPSMSSQVFYPHEPPRSPTLSRRNNDTLTVDDPSAASTATVSSAGAGLRKVVASPRQERRRPPQLFEVPQHSSVSLSSSPPSSSPVLPPVPFECPANATLLGLFSAFEELYVRRSLPELELELQAFITVAELFYSLGELMSFLIAQLRDESVSISVTLLEGTFDPLSHSSLSSSSRSSVSPPLSPTGPSFYVFVVSFWFSYDERAASVSRSVQASLAGLRVPSGLLQAVELAGQTVPPSVPTLPIFDAEQRGLVAEEFWALQPREAVAHIASAHRYLRDAIRPWHLLQHNSKRNNRQCLDCCNHFNAVVAWISSTILKQETPHRRARQICRWVKLAEVAHEMGELSVVLMLTNALNHVAISRLKKSWEDVPSAQRESVQRLLAFCSPLANFKGLREASRATGQPLPLAIVLKDLLFTMEVAPEVPVLDGIIHYERFRHLGKMLVTQSSAAASSKPAHRIVDFLLNPVPRYSEEKLYNRSREFEPPANGEEQQLPKQTHVENALIGALKTHAPSPHPAVPLLVISPRLAGSAGESDAPATTPTPRSIDSPRFFELSRSADSVFKLASSSSSPPVETRQENQLFLLLRQQQRKQKDLLPKPALSSSLPSSPSSSSPSPPPLPLPSPPGELSPIKSPSSLRRRPSAEPCSISSAPSSPSPAGEVRQENELYRLLQRSKTKSQQQ